MSASEGAAAAGVRVTVAVAAPLRQLYDYRAERAPARGCRVWVPFGHDKRLGIVLAASAAAADELDGLKPIAEVLDETPLLSAPLLELAEWSAGYYHHPLGDVIAAALPTWLRRRRPPPEPAVEVWAVTPRGAAALAAGEVRGPRQRELLALLEQGASSAATLGERLPRWREAARRMRGQDWLTVSFEDAPRAAPPAPPALTLNDAQHAAAAAIGETLGRFQVTVVDGVTGSGKTEVYLDVIAGALAAGDQALVLVPEIALTQQLVQRFRARFGEAVAVLHSALTERERVLAWDACRRGRVGVLVGTRSAVWAELPRLALIVVDEEHDGSYKQQDGFRYSARDVAIVRGRLAGVPVVLGSATPALETLANIERGKFGVVHLAARARAAAPPRIDLIDIRGLKLDGGLSPLLIEAMREHLARGEQVMLFLNRRGYAPLLICRSCGELRRCDQCDAYLVLHKGIGAARCHHCDRQWSLRRPARCCDDEDVQPVGLGTERLEEAVREAFPAARVSRVDRDSVRRAGELERVFGAVAAGEIDILIGTQMVAKGLDFSGITLVGIVDADGRLYSVDFRAEERLAQLLIQVAGRAGRGARPGQVLVQTHHPEHPVLRRIIDQGYAAYSRTALAERRETGLPPYAAMALVRAESRHAGRPLEFLADARERLLAAGSGPGLDVSYPIPALMERRAGRYRALVVVRSPSRGDIGRMLTAAVPGLERAARAAGVRWSLDVDPQDTL